VTDYINANCVKKVSEFMGVAREQVFCTVRPGTLRRLTAEEQQEGFGNNAENNANGDVRKLGDDRVFLMHNDKLTDDKRTGQPMRFLAAASGKDLIFKVSKYTYLVDQGDCGDWEGFDV
jgi:hypothetical protein